MPKTQPDFDDETLHAALAAGSDELLVAVAAVDPETVGVSKNYVRNELIRAVEHTDGPAHEAIQSRLERSGDFITALYEGDLAEALIYADGSNKPILFHLFSRKYLLAVLAEDRGSMESARRWLDPYLERYGE
jgi:hypothetical protein